MIELVQLDVVKLAVLVLLAITVFLFVLDILRVDVVALFVLVLLGLSSLIPSDLVESLLYRACPPIAQCAIPTYEGLLPVGRLFDGFSSNAVVSIIAVMIIGGGLDKTGALNRLAAFILDVAGNTERKIMTFLCATVGTISGFMQNIGAAALFLPVTDRISKNSGVPIDRLLMPMGYCAILGGTLTMVGSSPLILLNDLIVHSSSALGEHADTIQTFGLFSVTPIGAVMLVVGMIYFAILGRFVLPSGTTKSLETGEFHKFIKDIYGISGLVFELRVNRKSSMIGRTIGDIEDNDGYEERIIAINSGGSNVIEPARSTVIHADSDIAIMGSPEKIREYAAKYGLEIKKNISVFKEAFDRNISGIAEVVVPPHSPAIGKTMGDLGFRRKFRVTLMACYRNDAPIRQELIDLELKAGDSLVVHSMWRNLQNFAKVLDFVIVNDVPREDFREEKTRPAMLFFMLTVALVIFSDLPLSAALMTGAIGMIITGVLKMDEAYRVINWQSVFLLACLLPLGIALEHTDTALWLAQQFVGVLHAFPPWVMLLALAILATIFTLVMSNVGATVLLVPIAINIAVQVGGNPAVFALTVALATSNSFLIPTHQVNALIQGPGGYRVADFMRAGSVMTILFLAVMLAMVQILYGA